MKHRLFIIKNKLKKSKIMIRGNDIRQMRKEQRMSLPEVESRSGVNRGTISLIERGITHNAGIENVEAIANVLGATLVFQPINPINLPSQGTTETHIEQTLD